MLPELDAQLEPAEAIQLRAVLTDLAEQAGRALDGNVVGVYLKGSFALGFGDVHADVDFLVVTKYPLTASHEEAVREVHKTLPNRSERWAHVLEGSYTNLASLSERAHLMKPWLYVDNGNREMEMSTHDNSEVFRWVLKNRALTVTGPDAGSLLPDIPPQVVRDEAVRLAAQRREEALEDPEYLENGWGQPHEVLTYCRMLYTASTGEVTGKNASGRWCLTVLPTEWHPLIQSAIENRPSPLERIHSTADPRLTSLTYKFIDDMTLRIAEAATPPLSAAAPRA